MTVNPSMPLFLSAPRIEISIDNSLIGMAIGLNFNFSVDVQPIYTVGMYGPAALEPTFYNVVTGTIQLIRLSRPKARQAMIQAANDSKLTHDTTTASSALDWNNQSVPSANGVFEVSKASPTALGKNFLYTHLDPSTVMLSQLFDMTVKVRVPIVKLQSDLSKDAPLPIIDMNQSSTKLVPWMAIRGCRVTGRTTNITFGQIINEPLNFSGLLVTPVDVNGSDVFSSDWTVKDT
jgi:hypothetical protein